MDAASRASLAELQTALVSVSSTADLANDLRAAARLLAAQPTLRRAITDPARRPQARESVVHQLLESRIGADALGLLATAAGARWSQPSDIVTAMELLAVDAELALADAEGALSDVEDELFRFSRVVAAHPELNALLGDATVEVSRRTVLAEGLLAGKTHAVTQRLVTFALAGIGGRRFDAGLDFLVERAAARRERRVAYITAARPLREPQLERLTDALSRIYGQPIAVHADTNPALLGGIVIRIGDDLYDGSVLYRLDNARTELGAGR